MASVADHLVARLAADGIDHVFGVGGANIEDVFDSLHRLGPRPRLVLAKHEFGAATMADGYARTTGRYGVVLATSGGGALNLVAALGESFASRVPVLALVGQPPTALEGRGAFQDTSGRAGTIDAQMLFGQVSRFCARVDDPAGFPELLADALAAVAEGGPAVLLLPKDIQQTEARAPRTGSDRRPSEPDGHDANGIRSANPKPADHSRADHARAEHLVVESAAGTVVIIAGAEIARADARAELSALAVALDAAVVVAPDAKDVFPNAHPLYAGVAGIMGHPGIAALIADAALCLVVGTPLPTTERGGLESALAQTTVLHLGIDAPFVAAAASVSGELRKNLARLTAAAPPRASRARRIDAGSLEPPSATGAGIRYRQAVSAIAARLAPGDGVFADAGNTGAAVIHHLPVPEDGLFVVALGMGGMGYAFGAGIGSALGRGRRTYVLAGDGSFLMHGFEVHTAAEYQAPVTFVVFNNNAHAMCVTREQLYYSGDYTFNRFAPSDPAAAIDALLPGITARSASTLAELERALDETAAIPGPVFVCIDCDPDEIPPFAPFLEEFSA
ncbi:thiamine pyrophosphate-binding protein [Nocardia stercoris]|uniref:acetolactate synthase n=1 Tax=Nocardia stercoris TaxID=2483361 RepID=A0A3M2L408_9NOCA|nr:thiamine pyrophosphate-binding protein [Nocardia stercoris]RMI32104.1 thiamine pyrophosphate-binding protein [Nocardia stercoris]